MSRKRPKIENSRVVVESKVNRKCRGLFPRTFRALSFEEICSQTDCDGADVPVPDNGCLQPAHLSSPFWVVPSFDDICALQGIATTIQWENVEFTNMLTEDPASTDVKGDISLSSQQIKGAESLCEGRTNNISRAPEPKAVVDEPVAEDRNRISVTDNHEDSGSTLFGTEFIGTIKDNATDREESGRKELSTQCHNIEGKATCTTPSAGRVEDSKLVNTPRPQRGKCQRRRKFFSGQKLESICQNLMKLKDQKFTPNSPGGLKMEVWYSESRNGYITLFAMRSPNFSSVCLIVYIFCLKADVLSCLHPVL